MATIPRLLGERLAVIEPVERDRSADAWHRPVVKEQPGLHSDRVRTDEDAPDDDGRTSLPRSGRLVAARRGRPFR